MEDAVPHEHGCAHPFCGSPTHSRRAKAVGKEKTEEIEQRVHSLKVKC